MKKSPILCILFFVTLSAGAQINELQKKLDAYYENMNYRKALQYCDSLTPLIKDSFGPASKKFGWHLADNYAHVYEKMWESGMGVDYFRKAEINYKEGIAIIEKAAGPKDYDYAEQCINLGNMYSTIRFNFVAEEWIQKGLKVLRETGQTKTEGYVGGLSNLGKAQIQMEKFNTAEEALLTALQEIYRLPETFDLADRKLFECRVLSNLASLYFFQADYERSSYYIRSARDTMQKYNILDQSVYLAIENNMLTASIYSGDTRKTKSIIKEQQVYFDHFSIKPIQYYRFTLNCITFYQTNQQFDSAERLYRRLGIEFSNNSQHDPESYIGWLIGYCNQSIATGNMRLADSLQQILAAIDNPVFDNLNYQHKFGKHAAISYYHIAAGNNDKALRYTDSLFAMARNKFESNFLFSSEVDKNMLSGYLYESNIRYLITCLRLAKTNPALLQEAYHRWDYYRNIVLDSKQRFMRKLNTTKNAGILPVFTQWQQNSLILSGAFKEEKRKLLPFIDSISIATNALERQLNLRALVTRYIEEVFNPTDVYRQLTSGTALVEFIRLPEVKPGVKSFMPFYICFITRPGNPQAVCVNLGTEKELLRILGSKNKFRLNEDRLAEIYPDSRGRKAGKVYAGDRVYQKIWAPLVPYLGSTDSIYCITDGILSLVALHALPNGRNGYLRDRYKLHYLLSLRSYNQARQKDQLPDKSAFSLWGGIEYGSMAKNKKRKKGFSLTRYARYTFPNLTGTATEINKIADLLKKAGFIHKAFSSDTADEQRFYRLPADSANVLLFSTHGFAGTPPPLPPALITRQLYGLNFRQQNPLLNCGLALSGANEKKGSVVAADDGIINGYEISLMNLGNTKLAVLSACETAVGPQLNSEGIFGLQRAFKMAGVEKLVVSLWKVNDWETALFMEHFFKLLTQKKDIYTAFLETQQEMRNSGRMSPNGWGAFILIE